MLTEKKIRGTNRNLVKIEWISLNVIKKFTKINVGVLKNNNINIKKIKI